MIDKSLRIAIVEDNDVARTNLRNHLIQLDYTNIDCFSKGVDLRNQLRKKQYDVLLMDYYLGKYRNGVEVILDLQKDKLINNSTCIIFVTCDHLPLIVGQIVDVHPESLLLKPYNIQNLRKTLYTSLKKQQYLSPVYKLMDENSHQDAFDELVNMTEKVPLEKQRSAINRLKARLLIKLGRFEEACEIYKSTLKISKHVIWAKWGLIHCCYLYGDLEHCEEILHRMLDKHLTNDKACEWLARISIDTQKTEKALKYLDRIKDGNLSISGARLKAQLMKIGNRTDEALQLLDKKRQSALEIREYYQSLSFDMARCHLFLAEQRGFDRRGNNLKHAKSLIEAGNKKRLGSSSDTEYLILRALLALLSEDEDEARKLLQDIDKEEYEATNSAAISDAITAFIMLDDSAQANELVLNIEDRISTNLQENDVAQNKLYALQHESLLGSKNERAVKLNKRGLQYYQASKFDRAIHFFYQAYSLFPEEPAFCLNLLQSMVEMPLCQYRNVKTISLLNYVIKLSLTPSNQERLKEVSDKVRLHKSRYIKEKVSQRPVSEKGEALLETA